MRAWLLAVLLLLAVPPVEAAEPRFDLIVHTAPGTPLPPLDLPLIPLRAIDGFVVLDATEDAEARLARTDGVHRVVRAVPLERHAVAPATRTDEAADAGGEDLNLRLTRVREAWPRATGQGVTIAIIDSGIDASHPDLAGRVKQNVRLVDERFVDAPGDTSGHGTHVAGVAAASGASSDGRFVGTAPDAQLVGIDISSRFNTAGSLLAYDWLFVHAPSLGVDIVVNAWGRMGSSPFDPDDAVVRGIDRLVAEGVVVLFSASNHGPRAMSLSLEAQNPRVITVGAVDAAARVMSYSSRGPVRAPDGGDAWVKPDLAAPGDRIIGLRSLQSPPSANDPDPLHTTLSGTSQAVPHVAGIVALMLEANASLTPVQVANALRASAIDLDAPGPDDATGFGLVDAVDALRVARGQGIARDHPLIRGGVARYEGETIAAPAPAGSGLLGLAPGADVETFRLPIAVLPGARALSFDLVWSAPTPPSRVLLVGDDGARLGAWTRAEPHGAGGFVVRGRMESPPAGVAALVVDASPPAATRAAATVDVHLRANTTRALELDSRYHLPEPADAAASPAARAFAHMQLLSREQPWLLPALGAVALLLIWLPYPRRAKVGEPAPAAMPGAPSTEPPTGDAAAEPPSAPGASPRIQT